MVKDVKKYDFIDALRGLAILFVIIYHTSLTVIPQNVSLELLMSLGVRGVQLFYVTSALTLCMSWESRTIYAKEKSPIRNFFIRRFFRIAPMFYLAIFYYSVVFGLGPRHWAPNGITWWSVVLTVLFLHGFHPETLNAVVPGGWSIAIEMTFYLVLPFILSRIHTIKAYIFLCVFSIVGYIISRLLLTLLLSGFYLMDQQYLVIHFGKCNFLAQFPVFVMGILIYPIFRKKDNYKPYITTIGIIVLFPIILLLILYPFHTKDILGNPFVIGIVFAIFTLLLSCRPVRIIVNPVICMIGKISFSMYLTHYAVMGLLLKLGVQKNFPNGNISSCLYFFCVVIVTFCVSFLSYKLVEIQGIKVGRHLIDKLEGVVHIKVGL